MPADATSPKKLRNSRAAATHRTGYALRFIDHLDTGNLYGTDISPDNLMAAKK
ncbi:hypothetical protein HEP84_23300 [Streptomyces sp. RLB1-33]|uniref:hypothetical protein n=1 Tax=Streptomyces mirabilis TaxID=68239 RepID=UPI00143E8A8A|nr:MULTISPECIES: hypothetical protein [Streptomyces]QIY67929.1 hypothetical protein HEP84_23300 [Streptomyces sp. RLB1-33]QUW85376.1 hypothetical protein SMIR_21535 [Streptomyces mirabilis]